MKTVSLRQLIAGIPNQPIPVAVFVAPDMAAELVKLCQADKPHLVVEPTDESLTTCLGLQIHIDPDVKPNGFEIGFDADQVRERAQRLRARR